MKCEVCGYELKGNEDCCPICDLLTLPPVVGELTEKMKSARQEEIRECKEKWLKSVKVYVRAYHWEEENEELVEKFHEDILVADNLHSMSIDQVSWSDTMFAKQTAGETLQMTVVVDNGTNRTEHAVDVVAPDTEELWKVGVVLRTGLAFSIRVGDAMKVSDSTDISLK